MANTDGLFKRILGLLDDERVELRCAAALVLGAAGKGNAQVGKALAKKLDDPNPMMKRFVLDGLIEMNTKGLSRQITPLLDSSDDDIRTRALRLMTQQGKQAEGALRKQLEEGPPHARHAAAGLLVRVGTASALDALYEQLADPDIGEQVLQLLRAEIDRGDAKLKRALEQRANAVARRLSKKLAPKPGARRKKATANGANGQVAEAGPDELKLAAVLRLVGYIAETSSLGLLVACAGAKMPRRVRLAAIAGMRRILAAPSAKGADGAVKDLIAYADDEDPAIARSAVDTLRGARIPPKLVSKFGKLAEARNHDARRLALERMPVLGAKTSVRNLIDNLVGSDPNLREPALKALTASPEAAADLARALGDAEREWQARQIARALRAHEGRIPPATLTALVNKTLARLENESDPVVPVLLEALARVAPDKYVEALFERAAKLRKKKQYSDAFSSLRPLAQTGARLSDDQRFCLGVLGLKVSGKDLLRAARTTDPVLQQFAQLVGEGYPVAKTLLKQRDLELEDFFHLGFNFVESHDEDEKELGQTLLEAIVKKAPRKKIATAARNKLKLAGLA